MTADGKKVAVVLSGGGANGAYEVGVLKALASGHSQATDYQPLVPDIVTGTSIGAFNASFLASQWDTYGAATIGNLEQFWLERLAGGLRTNGVFRLRGNPLDLLDPSSYVPNPLRPVQRFLSDSGFLAWEGLQRVVHLATSSGPLGERLIESLDFGPLIALDPLERNLLEIDYPAIRRSRLRLRIAATNWATGELRVFQNPDMTDAFGPLAIRASAAVPGIFPPADFGSQPFVDGSVLLNTPLSLAIHAGADILHVIFLDPQVATSPCPGCRRPLPPSSGSSRSAGPPATRTTSATPPASRSLAAMERRAPCCPPTRRSWTCWKKSRRRNRRPAAARCAPSRSIATTPGDPLGGDLGLLDFNRGRIESLIERGFLDAGARAHADEHDVFPEPNQAAPREAPKRVA